MQHPSGVGHVSSTKLRAESLRPFCRATQVLCEVVPPTPRRRSVCVIPQRLYSSSSSALLGADGRALAIFLHSWFSVSRSSNLNVTAIFEVPKVPPPILASSVGASTRHRRRRLRPPPPGTSSVRTRRRLRPPARSYPRLLSIMKQPFMAKGSGWANPAGAVLLPSYTKTYQYCL